ncbi:MAG: aminotransferase class V-fold PLP-dependent enzyme [Lachnospiraceae bacterium]|nr:aminotransferase class V-fold PLP-dependent enzyme [Lachnospiraceae bacterium]
MDIFEELNISRYINAHDTYTVYGGSRMTDETIESMRMASASFVDMQELQQKLGCAAAKLTHNEAAYFTNGAAGGLTTAAAICMAKGSEYRFARLPQIVPGTASEIIQIHCQHNAYDKAVEAAGARIIEIGDADETLEFDLEGVFSERTAAVFYYASMKYSQAALPLRDVIRIAHSHGIPVVVDAAAQLPPVENLWKFTDMGADMVIFSGGKTLCGPQDSGLIFGKMKYIEDCIRFGAPVHGVCRGCKTSREAMAGLYSALKQYVEMNHRENAHRLDEIVKIFANSFRQCGVDTRIVPYGPVGQKYPRLFLSVKKQGAAQRIAKTMREKHIYVGLDLDQNAIYLSPLNLNEAEQKTVLHELKAVVEEELCDM